MSIRIADASEGSIQTLLTERVDVQCQPGVNWRRTNRLQPAVEIPPTGVTLGTGNCHARSVGNERVRGERPCAAVNVEIDKSGNGHGDVGLGAGVVGLDGRPPAVDGL
jgi:hypothetical protein